MSNRRKTRPSVERRRALRTLGHYSARLVGCTCNPWITERHVGPSHVPHLDIAHDDDCPARDAPTTMVRLR